VIWTCRKKENKDGQNNSLVTIWKTWKGKTKKSVNTMYVKHLKEGDGSNGEVQSMRIFELKEVGQHIEERTNSNIVLL
jgi:hypothetical protein